MTSLSGKVAVITGASSGVGRAVAVALANEGVRLAVVGRNADGLAATAAATGDPAVRTYRADLADEANVRDLAAQVERDFGRVDVLFHGAGMIEIGSVASSPVEHFDRQYRTNLRAPYLLTQLLLSMLRAHSGQIVFVNSSAALRVPAASAQYAATKSGLKVLADGLRDEVNAAGVRVLSLFLGSTATPMQQALAKAKAQAYEPERLIQPEDVAELLVSLLRLPATAEVTDVIVRPMMA
jgi:NAD(P)-dependent dehydrogenase (short-subunit alcohol dehydrogenase family)